jgi:RNase P subunit RPR2
MSFKVEKKGYIKENLNCPNCNTNIIVYLSETGTVHKSLGAELLKDDKRIRCNGCEAILSYQPKSPQGQQ